MFNKYPIKLIISHTDIAAYERLFITLGNKRGIPSINYQHGVEGNTYNTSLGFPGYATFEGAWGIKRKEWLVRRGLKQDSIEIIGCCLHKIELGEVKNFPKMKDEGVFLYLTQFGEQFTETNAFGKLKMKKFLNYYYSDLKNFLKRN
jgi:hypothetical protein